MDAKSNNNKNGTPDWNEMVIWTIDDMLEVTLKEPDDFLKVVETLTRIGIESKKEKRLTQSCHILHKRGKYFLLHFKELFLIDGKTANFTVSDLYRRNTIAKLLQDWSLLSIVNPFQIENKTGSLRQIKIIPFSQKDSYELVSKYSIGKPRDHDS